MYGKYAYLDNYSKKREVRREKTYGFHESSAGVRLKSGTGPH